MSFRPKLLNEMGLTIGNLFKKEFTVLELIQGGVYGWELFQMVFLLALIQKHNRKPIRGENLIG